MDLKTIEEKVAHISADICQLDIRINNVIKDIVKIKVQFTDKKEAYNLIDVRKLIKENYMCPLEFERELNLFSDNFVSKFCRRCPHAHEFGMQVGKRWYIKPLEFIKYIAKNHSSRDRAQRFLDNPRSMQMLNELMDKKKKAQNNQNV